jgi:uncharacterized protein with NAD-binding domain and iron-sulfur cluster
MAQDRDKHVVPQETSDKHQPQKKEQYLVTQQAINKHQPHTGPLSLSLSLSLSFKYTDMFLAFLFFSLISSIKI